VSNVIQPPGSELLQTCRQLRGDLEQLGKSALLAINPRGRIVVQRTQIFLEQVEDLADRVTVLEIGFASSMEKPPT
jgi:hypothetical protein